MFILVQGRTLFARIINVPEQYNSIQMGINQSVDGDTIIVSPGTYYENITLYSKNIVLGSLFLTTGDKSYISGTVLDGNKKSSTLRLDWRDSTTVISGFTITNGFVDSGGGIFCSNSNASFEHLKIINNVSTHDGGGIFCSKSKIQMKNVKICWNKSYGRAGGIYSEESEIRFDKDELCNIYLNDASYVKDIYLPFNSTNTINAYVDTFSVRNPGTSHIYPIDNVNVSMKNAKVEPVEADLYVSPDGNDENSGQNSNAPLRTLSKALHVIVADSAHPGTIYLNEGTYNGSHGEHFPLLLNDYLTLKGESKSNVIIDAEKQNTAMVIKAKEGVALERMTIINGYNFFDESISTSDYDKYYGGGICCQYSNLNLKDINLFNNGSNRGGGMYANKSDVFVENANIERNITFSDNENTGEGGGGLYLISSNTNLKNVRIARNSSIQGGGIQIYHGLTTFDPDTRCNIYFNNGKTAKDIYCANFNNEVHIKVDTFTVKNPTENEIYTLGNVTIDILHSKVESVGSDLYVSPSGNDSNSGLLATEPLKSITTALAKINADSENPHTIHLAKGIYSTSTTNEIFPLRMRNYVSLSGESKKTTIIDGERKSSVLHFEECKEAKVENLTIKGGFNENGGGIFCHESNIVISNINAYDNQATKDGGGIYLSLSFCEINNCKIYDNTADINGGGIYNVASNDRLEISSTTIFNNNAINGNGGGLYTQSMNMITFDQQNRCSIYLNNANFRGNDIYANPDYYVTENNEIEFVLAKVVLDTFTVKAPTNYYVYLASAMEFDIKEAKMDLINANMYVSPDGSDSNSGLSLATPLKTISCALSKITSDSLHPVTIHLSEGTYSTSENSQRYPIQLNDYTTLAGASMDKVILDAEFNSGIINTDLTKEVEINNVTITRGGTTNKSLGAIVCSYTELLLKNVKIFNNRGNGISFQKGKIEVNGCIIEGNKGWFFGGGIGLSTPNAKIINSVICKNEAYEGGGVYLASSPNTIINNVEIFENKAKRGGGIYMNSPSNVQFNHIEIKNNIAEGYENYTGGGGIYCEGSNTKIYFNDIKVSENFTNKTGGGLLLHAGEYYFKDASIVQNKAQNSGGGLAILSRANSSKSKIYLDDEHRSSIYQNRSSLGNDIYTNIDTTYTFALDTFTVQQPTIHHTYPFENIKINSSHHFIEQYNGDLYVSCAGKNTNSGLSSSEPLKTIKAAFERILADSLHPGTIHIAGGEYKHDNVEEFFPLHLTNFVKLEGDSKTSVTLVANQASNIFHCNDIQGAGLKNLTIEGGISSTNSDLTMDNVHVLFDSVRDAGDRRLEFMNSNLLIKNSQISDCYKIDINDESVVVFNRVIINNIGTINTAQSRTHFLNVTLFDYSNLDDFDKILNFTGGPPLPQSIILNSIFWRNKGAFINSPFGKVIEDYNFFYTNDVCADTIFVDPFHGDFRLKSNSPCIDAGVATFVWEGDTIIHIPSTQFNGSAPDIGAIEYSENDTRTNYTDENLPLDFSLNQNYPNPFNASTTIKYLVPKKAHITIKIYNLLGQFIATLLNKQQAAGSYDVKWDALQHASGIYFIEMRAKSGDNTLEYMKKIKCVIIK